MGFRLQVVTDQGEVAASFRPGEQAETEFVQRVADRVASKPVGVFRTTATVRQHVLDALMEVIFELKTTVKPSP